MKTYCFLRFALATLVVVVTAFNDAYSNENNSTSAPLKSDTAKATLSIRKPAKVGSILLRIEVTAEKETIHVYFSNTVPDCQISVANREGQRCSYTELGKSAFESIDRGRAHYDKILQEETKAWDLVLDDYFQLTPGDWTADVTINCYIGDFRKGTVMTTQKVRAERLFFTVEK